ncbi:MAG: FAD-dependent oxidoreductase [Thermodesulfobacteriota bacterium]
MEQKIRVYGAHWCPDCRRCKQLLGEHQIPFQSIDIEKDSEAEKFVLEKNQGKRLIPLIVFPDDSFLVDPSNAELAARLGLKTEAARRHYDLIIIGGGPAGLTAAIYGARDALETLVIERATFGGQAAGTETLDNMPGFPTGIDGLEFSNRLRQQAERSGVELLQTQEVARIYKKNLYSCVETSDGNNYSARALLITSGSTYQRLDVPGEDEYTGAGVHFCATCDGPFYKGKQVAVIGGGNSAAEEGLLLTRFADPVTMVVRRGELKATGIIQESLQKNPKIKFRWHTEVKAFIGEQGRLKKLKLRNNQTEIEEEMEVDGAFVFIGLVPNTDFLKESGLILDRWGFIVTGPTLLQQGGKPEGFEKRDPFLLETSLPGIFAAGDVRAGSTKQVVSAAGEGGSAALMIREYLKEV